MFVKYASFAHEPSLSGTLHDTRPQMRDALRRMSYPDIAQPDGEYFIQHTLLGLMKQQSLLKQYSMIFEYKIAKTRNEFQLTVS